MTQPIPLPPAKQPRRKTARGFTKAYYLTKPELEEIIGYIEEGLPYNEACGKVGTSHLQFEGAIKRYHQDLFPRLQEAREERLRRQQAALSSEHERPDASGVHQSEQPDG